jgi:hypothetical protein
VNLVEFFAFKGKHSTATRHARFAGKVGHGITIGPAL